MINKIKASRSIAWCYGCFGLMWMATLIILIIFPVRHYGIEQPMEILKALQAASGIIIYLLVMSSINIITAIAVWRVTSLSEKAQRIVLRIAIFFAVAAAIFLITTIASWFVNKMPDWFSPFNNVLPAALFSFVYSYFAFELRKLLRISNKRLDPDATGLNNYR